MNLSVDFTGWGPDDLACRVKSVDGIEGVTISGGEPFDQNADAMHLFLSEVHSAGLGVMAYTGYAWEELESDCEKKRLLSFVDILVDGPYVESEDHGELWRGSANRL